MKSKDSLDTRVINYLINKLNRYVQFRERQRKKDEHAVWESNFKGSDHMVHGISEDLKINLYRDSVLSYFIYAGFESDEIDFLNTFLQEGDCFVDIGANVGLFSLYAAKKVGVNGCVISFEPSGATFNRLIENIELNNIKNIRANKIGLSNSEQILELNVSENGYEAWNTFVPSKDNKFSKREQVQVKKFDDYFDEISFNTDQIKLIKLDVEGFELNVLKGAEKLLSKSNAPVFLVEFTDDNANAAGHCCHEIYKFLEGYGYTWFNYVSSEKKLVHDPLRVSYPYSNLVAIKTFEDRSKFSKFTIQLP